MTRARLLHLLDWLLFVGVILAIAWRWD